MKFAKSALAGSYFTIVSLAGVLIWIFATLIYPYDAITNREGSFLVQNKNKEVSRGETLHVRMNYCKIYVGTVFFKAEIESGGQIFQMPEQEFPSSKGCFDQILLVPIPKSLPIEATALSTSGRAHMIWTFKLKINTIRTVTQIFRTDDFTIIK